ncbi:MAG: FecR domain-containing protein [Pseudomonadota bacterium]
MLTRRRHILLLSSALLPQATFVAAQAQPVGLVEEIDGVVEATGDAGRRALTLGADVWRGDRLRSDAAGGCALRFADDTLFDIGASSEITIDAFVYDEGSTAFAASVLMGGFRFITGQIASRNPPTFQVRTPTAVIGVRGTHVAGTVEDETLHAMLLESELDDAGAAFIRNQAGETVLDEPGALLRWRDRGARAEQLQALNRSQQHSYFDRVGLGARLRRFHADRDAIREAVSQLPPAQRRVVVQRLRAVRERIRALPANQRPAALRRLRETLRDRLRAAPGQRGQRLRELREERRRELRDR